MYLRSLLVGRWNLRLSFGSNATRSFDLGDDTGTVIVTFPSEPNLQTLQSILSSIAQSPQPSLAHRHVTRSFSASSGPPSQLSSTRADACPRRIPSPLGVLVSP